MLLVFNPTAGAGRRRRLARALSVLTAAGLRPDVAETAHPGHAEEIAREAARRGVGVVVAAGGDGTAAEVASGIAGSAAMLGLLPLGTANVLAWELGLPLRPEGAAAVLARGRSAEIRPGVARFADGRTRLFVQMLGAGFDAEVVARLDLGLKRRIGRLAYVAQSLREMPRYAFPAIAVEADCVPLGAFASVIVTKGRLYAGRYLLAPGARPEAPGFSVVTFRGGGPARALLAGLALPLGIVSRLPGVEIRQAGRVALTGERVAVQADGDPAGVLPLMVEDAAGPVRVLLP